MRARYAIVIRGFWYEQRFKGLSDDARVLAMYLATCPHGNSEGLYRLPAPLLWHELGWDGIRTGTAMAELNARGLASHDLEAEIVFVPFLLEWDRPAGPKQIKGAVAKLAEVDETPLRKAYLEHARGVCPPLAEAIESTLDWAEEPPPDPPADDNSDETSEVDNGDEAQAETEHSPVPPVDNVEPLVPVDNDPKNTRNPIDTVSMGYFEFSTPSPSPPPSPNPPDPVSRARSPETAKDLGITSGDVRALVPAALARMRIAAPSTPTDDELAAVSEALAQGWTEPEILDVAARAYQRHDIDRPRRWTLTAWQRMATTAPAAPQPEPAARHVQPPQRYHPPDCPHGCSDEGWIDRPDGVTRCPGPIAAGA